MRRLYLTLLSGSLGWALAFQIPVSAVDVSQKGAEFPALSASGLELSQGEPVTSDLSCSAEEREDALSRFGCSCTACVSAVRQLRGQTPLRQLLLEARHPHQNYSPHQ